MKVPTRVETFKKGDQGSEKSQIEIIAVHPFKKLRLERERAHLKKLIEAALETSGANTSPKDKPRVSYYAVDPDDFRFGLKNSGKARFVKECQNLAKCVQGLLGKDPSKSDKRLIFLAHGLGAALTKHCLANQYYEYRETITERTLGVAFLDSWSDSRDRKVITDFVDAWIPGTPNLLEPREALPDKDHDSPDNGVDETKSVHEIKADAREEFIDLLVQVDDNFREIMGPGRRQAFQLLIDGRVFQMQWLGASRKEKHESPKPRLPPAPVVRTPSTRNLDPATKEGLTCIMKFLKDTSNSKDGLPPELNVFRYFTEHDEQKLVTYPQEIDGSRSPRPVADGVHEELPRPPGRSVSTKSVPKQSMYRQRFSRSLSTETNISRRAQSDAHCYWEGDQIQHEEHTQAKPKVGISSPSKSVEAATRDLYHQFVDMSAPSEPEEGEARVNSDKTMGWLAAKAASYVELRELDNADKVYEQIIRIRQTLAPGDAYLFVLHLRRAKVWHEMGRYKDAKAYIGGIRYAASTVQASQAMAPVLKYLARDLEWYRVLTKFRLGEHDKVDKLLASLTGYHFQQQIVARIINEPSLPWDENVQIVFRCKRILALNKAKMGHFGEAQAQIDELHSIIGKLNVLISPHDTASQQHASNTQEHLGPQLQGTAPNAKFEKQQPRKASALLAYTSASVYLLRGQHKTALTECNDAVQLLRETSGADSLDALEARKLEAHLLAYDWKPDSTEVAEVACKKSLRCVSQSFGAQHPVSLETMDVLVFILRRQARLSEALVTAQGLCRQCDQVLGHDRPQTRQSKSQLAAIHMSSGNYRDAVNLLKEIASKSPDEYNSPDLLRYEAELALALFRLGKFDTAAATIRRTILAQKVVFTRVHADKRAHEKPLSSNKFDYELAELMGNLRGKPGQDSKYMPHPDLLYSLEVLAQITSWTNLSLAFEQLALVLSLREALGSGSDQHTTEKTRLDVILMKRELSAAGYTYEDAERDLDELTKTLQKVLGPYHPDTASAKSELLLTRAILGREPRHALMQLGALKRQQKLEVGRAHPDTLRTRLAVLVVQLLLGDDAQATSTCRGLLEALRAPEVRNQRLVEALTMEERIAVLYANQGRFAECQGILGEMVASLEQELAPQVKELGLNDLVVRVKGLLEQISLYEAKV